MTTQEFSDQFDVLYNNITSNQAPGLNEYEKSVFLTKAQDEIVLAYFNQFDKGHKIQADFSNLIRNLVAKEVTEADLNSIENYTQFDPRATIFYIPDSYYTNVGNEDTDKAETNFDEVLILINEQILLKQGSSMMPNGIRQVIPVPYDEWMQLMSKPYKYPNKYQAWRLLEGRYNGDLQTQVNEEDARPFRRFVSILLNPADTKESITREYRIRYIKKPRPIVLDNFTDQGVSFSSDTTYTDVTECELDPIVHHQILDRAVELAKAAWSVQSKQPAQQA